MYYQSYEDYMRSVLGYPMENQDTYQNYVMPYQNTKELEDCYPQIYKMVNPIVCEMCDKYNYSINKDNIDDIVEEIYKKIEMNNEISIKINVENRDGNFQENRIENRSNSLRGNSNRNTISNISGDLKREYTEVENRQRNQRNPFLQDLIKILLLNRLLENNNSHRPPRPIQPTRPVFPGETRPPRREINDFSDFYRD